MLLPLAEITTITSGPKFEGAFQLAVRQSKAPRVIDALRAMAPDAGREAHILDRSAMRADAHARKASSKQSLALRKGFSTKLPLRCDGHGRPVTLHPTGGQRHDLIGICRHSSGEPCTGKCGSAALEAGGGHGRQGVLHLASRRVPSKGHRYRHPQLRGPAREPRPRSRGMSGPHLVQRLVGKLKQFRRVAVCYDKLDPHYLAFAQIASVMISLRALVTWPRCRAGARGRAAARSPRGR